MFNTNKIKETEIKPPCEENTPRIVKPEYLDIIKIMCPYCGNRHAERRHIINNIREAVYLCTYCGKRVK